MKCIYRTIFMLCTWVFMTDQGEVMAQGETKTPVRTIRLDATGSVKAKPDIAQIAMGVSTEAETARAALDKNSAAMTRVIDALKQAGLVGEDIQTVDFSVSPPIKNQGKTDGVTGFRVTNLVQVTVRDLTKLGDILDKAVSQGSNEMGGIQFTIAQPAKLMDEARRQAMAAAIQKAELYAQAAGARLARVISIDEQGGAGWRPQSMARASARSMEVPIEVGEAELQVSISVTWELGDAAPKP